jgi:predicted dehydrogenase
LAAAIVGLGQVGLLFDEEPQRRASGEIWTHFTAYERLSGAYALAAAVEPDPAKHAVALRRLPDLRIYPTVEAMLERERPDVVSVCTPDATHLAVVERLLGRCQGIFLEKPLCSQEEIVQAEALALRARDLGVSLRVNYYKRQESLVRQVAEAVAGQQVANVCVKYSGPFPAVGSHALNLMLLFSPDVRLLASLRHPREEGDGYSGFFRTQGGGLGQVLHCGPRHQLIFSAEATARGLYSLERNLSRLRVYAYAPSSRYQGYDELEFVSETPEGASAERFTGFLAEIAGEIAGGHRDYANLEDSLATQRIMQEMQAAASGEE